MNQKERLVGTLHREEVDAVPCMGPMQTGILGLMQASGSFWPEVHRNPRKMADLALAANRFAGLESARVPFETAVDASAFGVRISDRGLRVSRWSWNAGSARRKDLPRCPFPIPVRME